MNQKKNRSFSERVAALSDKTWNTLQIVGGIVLGGACIGALFFSGEESSFSFIIAVVLALFLPRFLEEKAERPIMKGRIALCITIAIGIAAMALMIWLKPEWISK